ncbi:MAG TPA: hypothetical protein VMW17_14340 [Candidatus Binatia bacterium]|nr:hypothetical protein [Candidatus Binatia bacterium]
MKAVLRMPVAGLVVIRGFDLRLLMVAGREVVIMMVMVRFVEIVVVVRTMLVILVGVDVNVIAVGMMVEVESGARRRDRRAEHSQR